MAEKASLAAPSRESQAILSQRARFHLVYRLAGRAYQVLHAKDSLSPVRTTWGALGFGVGDIVGAAVLRRSDRFAAGVRLTMDALDSGLWSRISNHPDAAALTGVPLAMEAGIREGAGGLLVPAVNSLAVAIARRRRPALGGTRWQVMAVGFGSGLNWYAGQRRAMAMARHTARVDAERQRSYLAGQNDVAVGADTVLDLLSRTTPLLMSFDQRDVIGRMLRTWKDALASATTTHATYLGTALVRWQQARNALQPVLSNDVIFDIAEGDGTVLLTATQASQLDVFFDQLSLRGQVPIRLVEATHIPGRVLRLLIGDAAIELPADSSPGLSAFDPGPIGLAVALLWFLDTASPGNSYSSMWAVAPIAGAALPMALWAHRELDSRGEDARASVLFAALGLGLVHAVAATTTMRRTTGPDGVQRYPFLASLSMTSLLLPLYLNNLSRVEAAVAIALIVGTSLIGLVLFPEPVNWTHFLSELLWPMAAMVSMARIGRELERDTAASTEQLAAEAAVEVDRAFQDGRSSVITLVSEARYAANRALSSSKGVLDATVVAEAESRLREVDRRLEALSCANG